jgi:hypothetical protein
MRAGLRTLKRGLKVTQTVWPECLDTVFILNASWGFQVAWKIFSVWMDARTRSKFVVSLSIRGLWFAQPTKNPTKARRPQQCMALLPYMVATMATTVW